MKILSPTIWSISVFLLFAISVAVYYWTQLNSPEWNQLPASSTKMKLFLYSPVAAISSIICITIFFPSVALANQGVLTIVKWVLLNSIILLFVSVVISLVVQYFVGFYNYQELIIESIRLSVPVVLISFIITVPIMFLWFKLATNANA